MSFLSFGFFQSSLGDSESLEQMGHLAWKETNEATLDVTQCLNSKAQQKTNEALGKFLALNGLEAFTPT